MCILSTIKSLLSGGTMKTASDIVGAIAQLVSYYEANASTPGDASKKDAFLDALILLLQKEKSTAQ